MQVEGSGIAARCAARLLADRGLTVQQTGSPRMPLPAVLLSQTTQRLLRDVFRREDLLEGGTRVRWRVVAWGGAAPVRVAHEAVVIPEAVLFERLALPEAGGAGPPSSWTLHTSRSPVSASAHTFGSRQAVAHTVVLTDEADGEACLAESVETGWLFLLPLGDQTAVVLDTAEDGTGLMQSRLVAGNVARTIGTSAPFPCAPRLAELLGGEGWIACGAAAVAFDPLCGDGTGHAIRTAILASATLAACDRPGPLPEALLAEYRARTLAAMSRHLELCHRFYASGGAGTWWRRQVDDTLAGMETLGRLAAGCPAPRLLLDGFSWRPVPESNGNW